MGPLRVLKCEVLHLYTDYRCSEQNFKFSIRA